MYVGVYGVHVYGCMLVYMVSLYHGVHVYECMLVYMVNLYHDVHVYGCMLVYMVNLYHGVHVAVRICLGVCPLPSTLFESLVPVVVVVVVVHHVQEARWPMGFQGLVSLSCLAVGLSNF